MAEWRALRIEEIPEQDDGRCPWRPVGFTLGITSFGVNTWTARAAGDRIVNEHDESEPGSDEELYLVVQGRATFELDGQRVDAPVGTFVVAQPGVRRTAFAEEAGTTILALGGSPGRAYERHIWPLWGPVHKLYAAGRHDEAADACAALLAEHPDNAGLLYNTACVEALAGRREQAVAHLRRALELSDRTREWARDDPDVDAIRDDPEIAPLLD